MQRHSMALLETALSLAIGQCGGGVKGNSPGIAESPFSHCMAMVALEESVGGA